MAQSGRNRPNNILMTDPPMLPHARKATVADVAETTVVLNIDGVSLSWPRAEFQNVKTGDEVYLVPFTKEGLEDERNEVAKALLNSVLNPNDEA